MQALDICACAPRARAARNLCRKRTKAPQPLRAWCAAWHHAQATHCALLRRVTRLEPRRRPSRPSIRWQNGTVRWASSSRPHATPHPLSCQGTRTVHTLRPRTTVLGCRLVCDCGHARKRLLHECVTILVATRGAGDRDDAERCIGSLGNITADEEGTAVFSWSDRHVRLIGPLSVIGRAVVITSLPDDGSPSSVLSAGYVSGTPSTTPLMDSPCGTALAVGVIAISA
ncbi:MAG: superoxide dismutase family protein [Methanosarcinales archaeon]|nr:MAG: superoxide dismutase family protein [Methanosarcinales archaeon]